MSIDTPLESASLTQLQQTPIDNVLHIIDEGLVHLPTYRELYYRWERQQWRAQDIDFSGDRKQWEGMSQDERDMRMYGLSAFFHGEACVTDTFGPFVIAMPDEEMRIFATTQLVDEARHTVFFARFFKEVLGVGKEKLEDALAVAREYMPFALECISPAPEQVQIMLANGEDPWTTPRYGQESLGKKLKVMCLSMKLPQIPAMPT